jgi:PAS domain S-box-containing protein
MKPTPDFPPNRRKWDDSSFRKVLEGAPDAVVIVDSRGKIVLVNGQAEKLFGYLREEMLGNAIELLVPARFRESHTATRHVYVSHPETRPMGADLELDALRKDGSELPVEISLSPVRLDGELYVISTIRDITARKMVAQELKRLNQELTAINRELEAFTYSVSHDLRAPVRHIESFSRMLREEYETALDDTAKHYLQRISESTAAMANLIEGLLGLARLGRKELQLEITGLDSIAEEVLHDFSAETQGRQIDWRVTRLPFAECDATLLKQVFSNLVSNALKFTRQRETAVIEIGYCPTQNGPAVFVRDNGVGFSMKYVNKLFGVFQRLHRAQDFEGTGAGLAIVQRIIHKHGGKVWAEAELNAGATFYFTLEGMQSWT